MFLSVNIDHVATLRQSRLGKEPNPTEIIYLILDLMKKEKQLQGITFHLREDRRHIQDDDVAHFFELFKHRAMLNFECAPTEEMQKIVLKYQPHEVTLVPEKREELTTEGGLDVKAHRDFLSSFIRPFQDAGIQVSLFVDANEDQIDWAHQVGANAVELHTGEFASGFEKGNREDCLTQLIKAAQFAHSQELHVNAGHGLNVFNVRFMKLIPHLKTLNIGHSIIARSVLYGIQNAVVEILDVIK